jgi:uncharacterized membrane-anchored protein
MPLTDNADIDGIIYLVLIGLVVGLYFWVQRDFRRRRR